MRILLVLWLAICPAAAAQLLSFGLKSGFPLNDAYSQPSNLSGISAASTNTHRYVFGPALELHLPARFSVEASVLYRSSEYSYTKAILNGLVHSQNTVYNLEVPIVIKRELLSGPVRPFVDAGISFRHLFLSNQGISTSPDSRGGVIGAGLLFKAGPIRIAPELRYTRWGSSPIAAPTFESVRNQSDFLIAIKF